MKKTKGIRSGEIILIPVNKMVGAVKKVKNFIVGHSETGHHHVIESETPLSVDELNMYVELFGDAAVVHKKSFDAHKTLPLAPGKYKRYEMVEYDIAGKVTRRVID